MSADVAAVEEPLPSVSELVGRGVAARALLSGGGSQSRVSELLGVSRRTVGRLATVDMAAALHNEEALTLARACLAERVRPAGALARNALPR
jgi:hypothetical protein